MPASGAQLKRALIFVHRWMGVLFCLLFLTWFVSGIVMMYWQYPQVSVADRLSRAPALDASRIHVLPQQAYARLGIDSPPLGAQLVTFDGRPAYRFRIGLGDVSIVYADTGEAQEDFSPELTLRIASAWTGQPSSAAKEEDNTEEDQWTVAEEFAELRPLRKYSWPDGQQVYVSTITGDVVQYTTRGSRRAAYFGAIPHWLYFTPLRRRGQQWSRVVIWSSGLGTIAAILGITVGLWMYSPSRTYRYAGAPASFPYHGQKRWHAILGLFFGFFACTWAFSGMLSMDPFPKLQEGADDGPAARLATALREMPPLEVFAAKPPQIVLAEAEAAFGIDAERMPLHRRDHGLVQAPRRHQGAQADREPLMIFERIVAPGRLRAILTAPADVEADAEAAALRAQHDHAGRRIVVGPAQRALQLQTQLHAQGIELVGSIQRDDADLLVDLIQHTLRGHPDSSPSLHPTPEPGPHAARYFWKKPKTFSQPSSAWGAR